MDFSIKVTFAKKHMEYYAEKDKSHLSLLIIIVSYLLEEDME